MQPTSIDNDPFIPLLPFVEYATAHFAGQRSTAGLGVLRLNHGGEGRLWLWSTYGVLIRAYI